MTATIGTLLGFQAKRISLTILFVLTAVICCKEKSSQFEADPRYSKARNEVELKVRYGKIEIGLSEFKQALGRFPSQDENLEALVTNPSGLKAWAGPYLDKHNLKDPWGQKFIYEVADDKVRIFSRGVDGNGRIDIGKLLEDSP